MKRILTIGSLLVAIVAILFSISQWNAKVDKATEKAKEEIDMAAEKEPSLIEQSPSSDATNEQSDTTNSQNKSSSSGSGNGTNSQTDTTETADTKNKQITDPTKNNEGPTTDSVSPVPPTTGKTSQEIKAAYRTIFYDLEVQETSKVDQLLVQAKADYVSGKLSKADLLVKYQDAAVTLERNADQLFNTLYSQLQTDLEKNGHGLNQAAEFKNEYQTKKQQRLSRVINQLQNF